MADLRRCISAGAQTTFLGDGTGASNRLWGAALMVWSVAASIAPAHAQDVAVSRDERARETFQEGRLAFQQGELRIAAARFERAFELSGRPMLLLNVAAALEALGDQEGALSALQQYLILEPESEQRPSIAKRIERLGGAVPRAAPAIQTIPKPKDPVRAQEASPSSDRLFTWVAAGLAGATLITGVALFFDASARYQSLSATCGAIGCPDDEVDGVAARLTAAWTLTGAFVGFAALATVLFFVEGSEHHEHEPPVGPKLQVEVGPGSLALRGSLP